MPMVKHSSALERGLLGGTSGARSSVSTAHARQVQVGLTRVWVLGGPSERELGEAWLGRFATSLSACSEPSVSVTGDTHVQATPGRPRTWPARKHFP